MRLKNISKNLTAKLTVNRINRLLRLKRFGSVRLIGFGYILPTPRSSTFSSSLVRTRRAGGELHLVVKVRTLRSSVQESTPFLSEETIFSLRSLSSLIRLPCQHFTYVTSHLIEIETIINSPLVLPSRVRFTAHDGCRGLYRFHCAPQQEVGPCLDGASILAYTFSEKEISHT